MGHMILATAVYENGVLKLLDPPRELADGDRVELALVRVVPVDKNHPDEVARRERIRAEADGIIAAAAAEPDDGYDILEALNANRLREGARPFLPPGGPR